MTPPADPVCKCTGSAGPIERRAPVPRTTYGCTDPEPDVLAGDPVEPDIDYDLDSFEEEEDPLP